MCVVYRRLAVRQIPVTHSALFARESVSRHLVCLTRHAKALASKQNRRTSRSLGNTLLQPTSDRSRPVVHRTRPGSNQPPRSVGPPTGEQKSASQKSSVSCSSRATTHPTAGCRASHASLRWPPGRYGRRYKQPGRGRPGWVSCPVL